MAKDQCVPLKQLRLSIDSLSKAELFFIIFASELLSSSSSAVMDEISSGNDSIGLLTDYFDGAINFEWNVNLTELPNLDIKEEVIEASKPSNLCPICSNEAGKHSHYGGRGCSSCRAFFRRSVQTKGYERFTCKASQSCSIDSKSWKSCKFCRFQKCLQSGMKPSLVLNEDERKIRHEKRTGNSNWIANHRSGIRANTSDSPGN